MAWIRWCLVSNCCLLAAACFTDDGRSDASGSFSETASSGDETTPATTDTPEPSSSDASATDTSESETTDSPATTRPDSTLTSETATTDSESDSNASQTTGPDPMECIYPLFDCNDNDEDGCEEDVSANNEHCGACNLPCGANCIDGDCIVGKYAFITESKFTGDLGGLNGADEICTHEASLANLPGTYAAWLSTGSSDPASRFSASLTGYMMPNGSLLAASWDDLTDGTIANELNVNQYGDTINYGPDCNESRAWSNTGEDGHAEGGSDCEGWQIDILLEGRMGNPGSTGKTWSVDTCSPRPCNESKHLYCFQQ